MAQVRGIFEDPTTGKLPATKLPTGVPTASDLAAKANDSVVVKLTGSQTVAGVKDFTTRPKYNGTDLATTTEVAGKLPKPTNPGAPALPVIAADGTVTTTPLSAVLPKPANPSGPAAVTVGSDGSVSTTLLSSLGSTGPGGATLNPRGPYAPGTAYAVGDSFTYEGAAWVVLTAHTAGSTPDTTKAKQYGVDPASAAQLTVDEDAGTVAVKTTGGSILLTGAFVPDAAPTGGDDWATVFTHQWLRAGLPATGTDIDGLSWTAATSGTPALVAQKIGAGGTVNTTHGGVKYLDNENCTLAATLPAALLAEPGADPAAAIARFALAGPLNPNDGFVGYVLRAASTRIGLLYDDSRSAGNKVVWQVEAPGGTVTFPLTGITAAGVKSGATVPNFINTPFLLRVVLDGPASKLYVNGTLQGTFDATGGSSTAFDLNSIELGNSTGRGFYAVSDVLLCPTGATPARIAAAEATIPAGA